VGCGRFGQWSSCWVVLEVVDHGGQVISLEHQGGLGGGPRSWFGFGSQCKMHGTQDIWLEVGGRFEGKLVSHSLCTCAQGEVMKVEFGASSCALDH